MDKETLTDADFQTPAPVAAPEVLTDKDFAAPSTITEPPVPTATTYVADKNLTLEHPADMSHDQLNDAIQTEIYGRPRNLSFKFDPTSPSLGAAENAVQEGVKESEKFIPEQAKALTRVAESVPKGISALIGVMGDAGVEKAKELLGPNFDATVSKGFADMGNNAYEFYKDRGEKGWEAPDPETFRGSFMSNPSVTRLAADVIQSVPLVAATAVAATSTGGAAPIALFGGMAAGEAGKAAEEHGETAQQSLGVGMAAGIGNAVLMSLPIGKWIEAAGLKGGVAGAASFGLLDTAMVPFNNTVARLGGDKSKKLWDGFAESLLAMAASGFTLGSFQAGGAAEHDADVSAATKAGVTPNEINAMRTAIAGQITENPEKVTAAMLENMKNIEIKGPDDDAGTSFAFGENDKKNKEAAEKQLSPEEAELKQNIEDAQKTVSAYEAKQDAVGRIGKFKKPAGDVLKEELSQISSRFFSKDANAEGIDEVAERLGKTTNDLLDELQRLSKTSIAADKAAYKTAQKFLDETDAKMIADLKEKARVEAEAGREFVKNEPFTFGLGKNDKTTGDLARRQASEIRDTQRARAFHFREELEKTLPDETDQRALAWYRTAKGDTDWLKEAAESEDMAQYKDAIERAAKPSEALKQASERLDKFYAEWGEVGQEIGILPDELRDAYQKGWYKPEKATDFVKNEGGGGLSRLSTESAQHKVYNNMFEAVQNGKELATDNALELMQKYNTDMSTIATNKKLANYMTDSGLAKWVSPRKIPDGWRQVGTIAREIPLKNESGEPVFGDDKNQLYSSTILTAPKEMAEALRPSTDPNYLAKIDGVRGLATFQRIVKQADVAFGYFHDYNILKANLYSRGFSDLMTPEGRRQFMDTPNFKERELYLINSGGTTVASHPNTDVMASLREYASSLGEEPPDPRVEKLGQKINDLSESPIGKPVRATADALIDFSEAHKEHLFDEVMRFNKVQDFTAKMTKWNADNPNATDAEIKEAARGFADYSNSVYGGLNWEALGFSKWHVALLRLAEFAPDWTQSKIETVKQAFGNGTAGMASRKYLATNIAVGMLLLEGLNKAITGHFSNENEKGHFLEVEISPGVHVSPFSGVVEDAANLGSRVFSGGPIEGTLAWAEGKLSPAVRTATMLASRTLYTGSPVVERAHRGDPVMMTYDWVKALASETAPVPFAVSSLLRYLRSGGETSIPGAALVGSGIGKFSAQHKTKGQSLA